MLLDEDPYSVLNVPRTASNNDIKKAFRELALKLHPDKNPLGSHLFKRVNRAYQILGDEHSRKEFDEAHPMRTSKPTTSSSTSTPAAYPTNAAPASTPYSFRPGSSTQAYPNATSMPGTRPGSASQQRPTAAFRFPSAEQTSFTTSQQFKEAGIPAPSPNHAFHYSSSTGGFTPRGNTSASRPQSSTGAAQPAAAATEAPSEQQQRSSSFSMPPPTAHPMPASTPTVAEELASMRARHEAAQKVDMSAWDRIRKQPLGGPPAEPAAPPAPPPPPPQPTEPMKAFSSRPQPSKNEVPLKEQPASRPTTGGVPPPQQSDGDELLNAFKRKAQANAPQPQGPAAPPPPATAPSRAEESGSAPPSRPPPRPFSAGLTRHNIARSATPNLATETAAPTTASSSSGRSATPSTAEPPRGQPDLDMSSLPVPGSKNFDKSGAFVVPADSVLLSLTDEGLQLFVANMERKLRLARQEVLVRTYGRPPQS